MSAKPLLSVRELAFRLRTSPARLGEIAANIRAHYRIRPLIDKKNRSVVRHLTVPTRELRDIQRRIVTRVILPLGVSESAHGGVATRSTRTNASQHLAQPWVATLDVRRFFPSVRHYVVHRVFRHELGCGRDVAYLLTRLTTVDGGLPQGAPTSTALANLVLAKPVDARIGCVAKTKAIRYTRFVDDIALSGQDPKELINRVAKALSLRRLRMYRRKAKWETKPKLRIVPRSQRQEITGLVVNGSRPTVSGLKRSRIRTAIWEYSKRDADQDTARLANSIRGRIAYVSQFNPGAAKRMRRAFELAQTQRERPNDKQIG